MKPPLWELALGEAGSSCSFWFACLGVKTSIVTTELWGGGQLGLSISQHTMFGLILNLTGRDQQKDACLSATLLSIKQWGVDSS